MRGINPSLFPIDLWLHSCKPGVAYDGLVLSEISEIKTEWAPHCTSLDFEVWIVLELATFIFGIIDIEDLSWSFKWVDGQFKPSGIGEVHEVLCGPRIHKGNCFSSFCNGVNVESYCHRFPG